MIFWEAHLKGCIVTLDCSIPSLHQIDTCNSSAHRKPEFERLNTPVLHLHMVVSDTGVGNKVKNFYYETRTMYCMGMHIFSILESSGKTRIQYMHPVYRE